MVDFTPHIAENKDFMIWFVILVAVNLQSAFLTPPFGFALFYMKATVPPAVTMMHIYRGIVPFVILQVLDARHVHLLAGDHPGAAALFRLPRVDPVTGAPEAA